MSSAAPLSFETTHRVRDLCLCLHLQRAARSLARRFDNAFRPLGLTNGQFSLLMSLNRPDPPGMAPVATLLAMDRTTLTAALKPLERRGLVKAERDPADRRNRRLKLTTQGKNLLARAVPVWERTSAEVEAQMEDGNWNRLLSNLRALC
jgi:DNA-binding MarR family transcriptional regulator